MWIDISYYIKFEFNSKHKAIYNFAIPYLMVQTITYLKFLEVLENNQIHLWLEHNFIILDRIMIKV